MDYREVLIYSIPLYLMYTGIQRSIYIFYSTVPHVYRNTEKYLYILFHCTSCLQEYREVFIYSIPKYLMYIGIQRSIHIFYSTVPQIYRNTEKCLYILFHCTSCIEEYRKVFIYSILRYLLYTEIQRSVYKFYSTVPHVYRNTEKCLFILFHYTSCIQEYKEVLWGK